MKASGSIPNKYIFKLNYKNTRASAEICLKLTFEKPEPRIYVIDNL